MMSEDDQLLDGDVPMDQEVISPDEVDKLLEIKSLETIDKSIQESERHLERLKAELLAAKSKKITNSTEYKTLPPPPSSLPLPSSSDPASSSSARDPRQQKPIHAKNIPKLMDLVGTGPKDKRPSTSSSFNKPSYASKAAKPGEKVRPKKEIVEDFLHIYASRNRKIPITRALWEHVDGEMISLLAELAEQGHSNPGAKVAHSGFDAFHLCGFIACRDTTSADWYKEKIAEVKGPDGESFRAWSKSDAPISRLCRVYIPERFRKINDDRILPILTGLNLPLQNGEISLKEISMVHGGRAAFIDVDMDTYSFIRSNTYKLEWLMGSVDCHGVAPIIKQTTSSKESTLSGVEGVIPLNKKPATTQPSTSSRSLSPTRSASPSSQAAGDSDESSTPSVKKTAFSKHNLAFSPLTPVKETRALEEEGQATPVKEDLRKRASQGQKNKGGKTRKTEPKSKDNSHNKSK
jgi:hypothetical protein